MKDLNLSIGEEAILAVPPDSLRILVPGEAPHGIPMTIMEIWEFKDRVQIALGKSEKRLVGEVSSSEFRQLSLRKGDPVMVHITNAFLVPDTGSGQ